MAPKHLVGGCPKAMLVCSLSVQGELGWGGGGGKMGKGRGESCEGLYRQEVLTQKCGLNYFLGKAVPEKFPWLLKACRLPPE